MFVEFEDNRNDRKVSINIAHVVKIEEHLFSSPVTKIHLINQDIVYVKLSYEDTKNLINSKL